MRRLTLAAIFLIVPFVLITCFRSTAAVSSDELARQVEKRYRSLKSLSMDFVMCLDVISFYRRHFHLQELIIPMIVFELYFS